MTLGERQRQLPPLVAILIQYAYLRGYTLTFGECYRTPEQAALNASKGIGIANSLHTKRLAIDLNLFKDGVYLTDNESYRPLGDFWKTLGGSWGGDWTPADSGHFSLEWQGVR